MKICRLARSFRTTSYEIPFERGREFAADVGRNDEESLRSSEKREKRIFSIRRGRPDRRGTSYVIRQNIDGRNGRAVKGRPNGGGHDQRGRHADRRHVRPLAHHDHVGLSDEGQRHWRLVGGAGLGRSAVHHAKLREWPSKSGVRTAARQKLFPRGFVRSRYE